MRLVFVHDNRFKVDEEGNLYSGGNFSNEVFKRYLDVCDELIVIGRCETIRSSDGQGYNSIDLGKISFVAMDNVSSISGVLKRPAVQCELREVIKKSDGVICRSSVLGFMAAKEAMRCGKPYLIEVVGCTFDSLWNHGSLKGKFYAPYAFIKAKKYIQKSRYTLYVTSQFLQKRYPTEGQWIACSNVELDKIEELSFENRLIRINKRADGTPIILGTVGATNVKYKGQQYVIRALAKMKKSGITNFQYQLIGEGDITYLKSLANRLDLSDEVKFLGKMNHQEIFLWLDSLDAYIQPSKTEGLPRAVVEAMSRGLICFGTRVGGIPELLEPEYLFSKSNRGVHEIVALLKALNKEAMILQARRNFEESKKYSKFVLDKRRRDFFELFCSNISGDTRQ